MYIKINLIMPDKMQIFAFLFPMLGPFKIIGPLAKITRGATPALTRYRDSCFDFTSLHWMADQVLRQSCAKTRVINS
jgi:hypothetical protein